MFKKICEFKNGQQMEIMRPISVIFDMAYSFVAQKQQESAKAPKILFQTISINGTNFNYDYEAPQNRVLRHGMLYNKLFNMYINTLETPINDTLLQKDENADDRPKVDFMEYNNMPEKYRKAFVPYDDDYYVLNINNNKPRIKLSSEQNKENAIKLLKRAKMLIPVIYKTETYVFPDIAQKYQKPAFVSNCSLSAYFVSDEQLKAVYELRNIFKSLAKITLIYKNKLTKEESLRNLNIYKEYVANKNTR